MLVHIVGLNLHAAGDADADEEHGDAKEEHEEAFEVAGLASDSCVRREDGVVAEVTEPSRPSDDDDP